MHKALGLLYSKEPDSKGPATKDTPRVLIIEVEILPIPEYKPHINIEQAIDPDLSQRITHYPPTKTLH